MDLTTIALVALGALIIVVAVVVMLRRSWGGSLDRAPSSGNYQAATGFTAPPEQDLAAIRALAASGNKIAAIKRVRELTGMGLKEAKDFVEALPAAGDIAVPRAGTAAAGEVAGQDLAAIRALAASGNKIAAIKLYRELTGVGLKEAKDYVDALI